ncbi:MAG: SDR family oxidoreductase [Nitrososphaerota archaeon]|nr:SDR family oxidoreductase [Nitrososphaerota archaeon]
MNEYGGKVAIVTGGGQGLGRALCEELATRSCEVVVVDTNAQAAKEVVSMIKQKGGEASAVRVDVSKEEEMRKLVDETVEKHGHLDYMINNAGVAVLGEAHDLTSEQWQKVLNVNLRGTIYGTLNAYRVMIKQRSGHIVNVASAAGLLPQPSNTPYSTSKHAVVGLSQSLRLEAAEYGVRVSAVCPGYIRTNIYQNAEIVGLPREQVIGSLTNRKMVEPNHAARLILDGVERNKALIVFPAAIRWAWRLYPFLYRVLNRFWIRQMRHLRNYSGNAS